MKYNFLNKVQNSIDLDIDIVQSEKKLLMSNKGKRWQPNLFEGAIPFKIIL